MNKLELLTDIYNFEIHTLTSYSKNYLMEAPKNEFKKEWKESKEKIKLLEELIDDVRSKIESKEQVVNKILVTSKDQLDELYDAWALTLIGLDDSDESINHFIDWIKKYSEVSNPLNVYITSGKTMNNHYNLTGNNRYNEDLKIVSIKNKDIMQLMRVAIPRFEIGGRWFNDIVDNNSWREEEKQSLSENEETEEFE